MRAAPHLRVVSVSNPDPVFRRHNLIAVASHEDEARKLVISLESEEDSDSAIGVVIMSASPGDGPESTSPAGIDPEHVSGYAARRGLIGAAIGAVIGAVVIGGATAAVTGGTGPVLGAAAGGALFAAFIGAIYVAFSGFGGSDAYRQTFVTSDAVDLAFVSLHTDDADELAQARERLADRDGVRLVEVDQDGRLVDEGRGR